MHDLNEITLERSGRGRGGRGWLGYLCLLSQSLRLVVSRIRLFWQSHWIALVLRCLIASAD